jgi:hypothetical protein
MLQSEFSHVLAFCKNTRAYLFATSIYNFLSPSNEKLLHSLCLNPRLWLNKFKVISLITDKKAVLQFGKSAHHIHQRAVGLWSDRAVPSAGSAALAKTQQLFFFPRCIISSRDRVWLNPTKSIVAISFASCTFQQHECRTRSGDEKLGHGVVAGSRAVDGVSTIIKNFLVAPETRCGQIGGKLRVDAFSRRRMTTH